MSRLANMIAATAAALIVFGSGIAPATAACKKMGFLVNDYGKEGPTADAQVLLDKHIAAWADEQGIEEYSVGKKTVKCELFIDLILFDEHTCTATATVCWGGSRQPKTQNAKAKKKSKSKTAKAKAKSKAKKAVAKSSPKKGTVVKKVAKKIEKTKPSATGAVETSALPKTESATKTNASPDVPYAKNAVIRNSGEPSDVTDPVTAVRNVAATPQTDKALASERAAADRAAAAAERAAAAAERAAAAAKLAAEAAKQAAAVSSGASSGRSAVVAPVAPTKTP